MGMAIRSWTTPITPCRASYQVGPLAGIIPASCNAEAGSPQHAKEESGQDKPESPSPATKDPDDEDSDKRRERNKQRRLNREALPIDLLQGLRVDLRGEDQNRNERDPSKHKESDHQLLGAIEGYRETQPERTT